ncbi:tetratricopeptide repeat protein [Oceanicella actignis]|uniref:tetratricopeptide repeat protein n=1 Tax=Oceanicella actignis TaxID=1189325 RepID=UPI0012564C5E|nr:tetratricopeptide repeat protein [Oceanicella actignis]TYO90817.1 FecR family protein [Oceanicella actignis]
MHRRRAAIPALGALALAAAAAPASAQPMAVAATPRAAGPEAAAPAPRCATIATLETFRGAVRVILANGAAPAPRAGMRLCPGDRIETGPDGRATVRFDALDTALQLNVDTTLIVEGGGAQGDVSLVEGMMRFLSSVKRVFTVRTALYSLNIDGTEVFMMVRPGEGALSVVEEGDVTIAAAGARLRAEAGQAVFAAPGRAPAMARAADVPPAFRRYLTPEGSIDWAVRVPPAALAAADPTLDEAARALADGRLDAALALLAPPAEGAQRPADAPRLALGAMALIARGRLDEAEARIRRALDLAPDDPAALTARGYLRQARGALDGALADARRAADTRPADPDLRARVAELALLRGDLALARAEAARAQALGPSPYALAMEGFAELAAYRDDAARAAFEKALALDPGAADARLGMAFIDIVRGDLAKGRAQLETLAVLDPRSARLRSLLGRAYFEEGRADKARAQFARAAEFDPDDPAPHLLSARERYAANRPADALRALERAAALAARRAPVRGARGLAEDDARAGAAQGRVYDALGFEELSAIAGARAARRAPESAAAHRFLAEAYRNRPDYGPARTSELLQSQLFARPSKAPIQPALGESNLSLTDAVGAARVSFEELAPLFDRDGLRLDVSGTVGDHNLASTQFAATALSGPISVSFGAFAFDTEGDEANDDARHRILAAQTHVQAAPGLTLFAEFRNRETDEGERYFSLISPRTGNRFSTTDNRARIGLRFEPSAESDYVALAAWRKIDGLQQLQIGPADTSIKGLDAQLRHDRRIGPLQLSMGAGWARQTGDAALTFTLPLPFPLPPITVTDVSRTESNHGEVWAYGIWKPMPWLETTAGMALYLSSDSRDNGAERDWLRLAPKLGAEADLGGGVTLRAAAGRMVKRPLLFDETLEPTQIAGFNQVFADLNGTVSDLAGLALDWRARNDLWLGVEGTGRWAARPDPRETGGVGRYETVRYDVRGLRAYAAWLIDDDWSASLGAEVERTGFRGLATGPSSLTTYAAPMRLRWNGASGLFAALDVTPFHQRARQGVGRGDSTDVIVDAAVGWRLPDQRGTLSLELRNLLDADFVYQDAFVRTEDEKPRRFDRDFSVVARAAFRF